MLCFKPSPTPQIYTLSLHDALPISPAAIPGPPWRGRPSRRADRGRCGPPRRDRKSTRLNSSHANISYAVFCLKKKNIRELVHVAAQVAARHLADRDAILGPRTLSDL